jgi:hypothetical protein
MIRTTLYLNNHTISRFVLCRRGILRKDTYTFLRHVMTMTPSIPDDTADSHYV